MIRGFTPASISLANSSSVLQADVSAGQNFQDITIYTNIMHLFILKEKCAISA